MALKQAPTFASLVAALSVAALSLACATEQNSIDSAPVLAADQQRIAAMIAADPRLLEATLHPTLTYVHSNGAQDTKESLIARLVKNAVDYRAIESIRPRVRRRGTTAVLTSEVKMQVAAGGAVHDLDMSVTAVYFLTKGRWQLAAYQSVRIQE